MSDPSAREDNTSLENQYAAPASATRPIAEFSFDALDQERARAFVGDRYPYYARKWRQPSSWNWAAFFVGFLWFLYRKMYRYAFIYLGILFVLSIGQVVIEEILQLGALTTAIDRAVNIAISVITALLANRLYLRHTIQGIQRVTPGELPSDPERRAAALGELQKEGGVNDLVPISVLVLFVSVVLLLAFGPPVTDYFDF